MSGRMFWSAKATLVAQKLVILDTPSHLFFFLEIMPKQFLRWQKQFCVNWCAYSLNINPLISSPNIYLWVHQQSFVPHFCPVSSSHWLLKIPSRKPIHRSCSFSFSTPNYHMKIFLCYFLSKLISVHGTKKEAEIGEGEGKDWFWPLFFWGPGGGWLECLGRPYKWLFQKKEREIHTYKDREIEMVAARGEWCIACGWNDWGSPELMVAEKREGAECVWCLQWWHGMRREREEKRKWKVYGAVAVIIFWR